MWTGKTLTHDPCILLCVLKQAFTKSEKFVTQRNGACGQQTAAHQRYERETASSYVPMTSIGSVPLPITAPMTVVTQGCRSLLRYLISSMNSALSFFQSCWAWAGEPRCSVLNSPKDDVLPFITLDLPVAEETKLDDLVPDIMPILLEPLLRTPPSDDSPIE